MGVEDVTRDLYGVPPGEFVAARDDAARRARDAGDRDAAAEIRKLRRPTVAAWAVNLLAADSPADIGDLLDLGERMRAAQGEMRLADLRELSGERTRLVSRLVRRAAGLAADAGQPPNPSVERDIAATLDAAVTDPAAGPAIRSGTLTKALSFGGTGFDGGSGHGPAVVSFPARDSGNAETAAPPDRARPRVRGGGTATGKAPGGRRDGGTGRQGTGRARGGGKRADGAARERDRTHREAEARREVRRRAVATAEDAVEAARRSRDRARQTLDAERTRRESAAAERHRLRAELDRAERALARADERVRAATDRVDRSDQALDRARHRLSEARSGRAAD